MYFYTYRIDFVDGYYYYGSRKSKVKPEEDKYWGTPKTHKEKWNTTMYCKTILDVFDNSTRMLNEETLLIGTNFKDDPFCLNQHNNDNFTTLGMKMSDETKRKQSLKKQNYVPWNKGTKGYTLNVDRRGKRHSSKLTKEDVLRIRSMYVDAPALPGVQVVQRNGKVLTYDRIFSKTFHKMFNLTDVGMFNIIRGISWPDV
jgi:hypothetical protein